MFEVFKVHEKYAAILTWMSELEVCVRGPIKIHIHNFIPY